MNKEHFIQLFHKHFQRNATDQETTELMNYVADNNYDDTLKDLIAETYSSPIPEYKQEEETANRIFNTIVGKDIKEVASVKEATPVITRRIHNYTRIAAAAAIILFIAITVILSLSKDDTKQDQLATNTQPLPKDVAAPTSTKARITLADGSTVSLDSLNAGLLANQGNVTITKTASGQIVYGGSNSPSGPGASIAYNTLSNPRGSQVINMTLADGSQVWLNAESSVTYPVAFVGNDRKVTVSGEGYFEIAKVSGKKFIVESNGVTTEVLGTHFNVNAYENEGETKVTLLEGSVRISKSTNQQINESTILKPGQQAQINASTTQRINISNNINLNEVMAWKNGRFEFGESTDLRTIMKQISRWYDVDVVYKGNIQQSFGGSISRQENISKLLRKFELTGKVKFNIEGKKVTVSN